MFAVLSAKRCSPLIASIVAFIATVFGAVTVSNATTGQTTHYLYDKSGRLFAEYNLSSNASKEYVHLGNKLVGQIATTGTGSPVTGCGFNVDGLGTANGDFTSDGLILARHARGLTNQALITNTRADQNPANSTAVINAINAHMSAYSSAHDIDASGGALTENDAIIINRYLAGFRGNALTQGVTLAGTRTNAGVIQTYIGKGRPTTAGSANTTTTTFIHPDVTGTLGGRLKNRAFTCCVVT